MYNIKYRSLISPHLHSNSQLVTCPRNVASKLICAGNGICSSIYDGAKTVGLTYDGWDGQQIQGCICDLGWTSYDCSETKRPNKKIARSNGLKYSGRFQKGDIPLRNKIPGK